MKFYFLEMFERLRCLYTNDFFNIDAENVDVVVHNVNDHNHDVDLEELKKDELKKKFTDEILSKTFVQSK